MMSESVFFAPPFVAHPSATIRRFKFLLFLLAASAMISSMCIISGLFFLPTGLMLHTTSTSIATGQAVHQHIPLTSAGRMGCTSDAGCSLPSISDLNFMVVGDIGGLPVYPYYSYAQTKVARAMTKIARTKPPNFIVNVGDNFYFNGVQSVFDDRFESSFEEIYDQPELFVPWYTIAGNHDHLGNVTAQMDHTNFSSRWTFPSLFYKLRVSFDADEHPRPLVAELLMLDTVVLCGNTVDIQGESLFSWLFAKKCEPDGPAPEYRQLARQQWEWIERSINSSNADYLFVVGHYPVHSVSEHGGFPCLQRLDSLLRSHSVSAYFSGHDHNLQHIKFPNRDPNDVGFVHYIVTGAASRTDRSAKHIGDVPTEALLFRYPTGWNPLSQIGFSNGGFVQVQLGREQGKLSFYSGTQELKHTFLVKPRKTVETEKMTS